jgi:lysine 6-dehydrogenase
MNNTFAILGAGMQGTCAAFDLAKFAAPEVIFLADASLAQAQKSADRVNRLVGSDVCRPLQLDVLDKAGLTKLLSDAEVALSCVPYHLHPKLVRTAIETKTNWCDLGGNTDVTMETLALDEEAKAAGISVVPDTGLAPGLVNSIGAYLIEELDQPESVKLYCGVLPQNPKPPFNYKLTFNIEGLVVEYDGDAVALRNGEIAMIPTLTELEEISIEELGQMEAFVTSGGTSTAPYTFQDRLQAYEYKTIRFPGHCELMRVFKDFGFWGENPVAVDGCEIVPRHMFYKVFGEALKQFADLDLCVVRGRGTGFKDGKPTTLQVDIFDRQCEETGFTSMERLTGYSISIHAIAMAEGKLPSGCIRYENALSGKEFLDELQRRGIHIKFSAEE